MSSPRKYSSPYLAAIPGLSSPAKSNKKRSKTSMKQPEPIKQTRELDRTNSSSIISPNCLKLNEPGYDASCGDINLLLLNSLRSNTELTDFSHKIIKGAGAAFDVNGAAAITSVESDEIISTSDINGEDEINNEPCNNPINQHHEMSSDLTESTNPKSYDRKSDSNNNSSAPLKPILKKPCIYKDKHKSKVDDNGNNDTKNKSTKSPKAKSSKPIKDSVSVKDNLVNRAMSKQKLGIGMAVTTKSLSKVDVPNSSLSLGVKSPRKKPKCPKATEVKTADLLLSIAKKSVRFSNKIDVYAVPYEARAGSRACDWQKNMMEQRMHNFRQLMKEVSSEELDFFGSSGGMLFAGYPPYHVPNPNFAIRGRGLRNFSNFKL